MDTVILDGTKYVKASEVARQFKYTSDYIGQLCRGKKVDARLVGRTWFVNPDSIVDHKKSRHSKSAEYVEKESIGTDSEHTQLRVKPIAVTNNKVGKYEPKKDVSGVEIKKLKVSYERDEEVLFPHISKREIKPAKFIRIEQAGAKKVKIDGRSKPYKFKTDELPEVALSGKIKVEPLEEAEEQVLKDESADKTQKNIPISESRENSNSPEDKNLSVHEKVDDSSRSKTTKKSRRIAKAQNSLRLSQIPPKNQKNTEIKFSPDSVSEVQPVKISNAVLLSPLIATVLALVVVTVLFSASSKTIVSQDNYQSDVVLQVANLLEVLRP